jgi:epoxyqueuosine reductase QueG
MMENAIRKEIIDFVAAREEGSGYGWKTPLVAYARADDPLFKTLKEVASPTHALPVDFLKEAQTVITYFIPFRDEIIKSNKSGRFTSRSWAVTYIETNKLIAAVNEHLQKFLIGQGYKAVFVPATHNFNETTLLSDWSHRSAAYIAGLGTFGVNHMLITESGCCGRIGSLITNLQLTPTPRPTREYCLHKADGSCGRCAKKCVNSSLTIDSLDKHKCYEMCLINADRLSDLESIADVCGKCLVGVPCSSAIPVNQVV